MYVEPNRVTVDSITFKFDDAFILRLLSEKLTESMMIEGSLEETDFVFVTDVEIDKSGVWYVYADIEKDSIH